MSISIRYQKQISIPSDCRVTLEGKTVVVSGPKGTLRRTFMDPAIQIEMSNNEVLVSTEVQRKRTRALVGTIIAHMRNMFEGVRFGHSYQMKIVSALFPITVEQKGREIFIKNLIGERGVRKCRVCGDVDVKITEDDITITGIDLEAVAQTAANIQIASRIHKKDRRVFLDGIYVIRKRKGEQVKSIV